MVRSVQGKVKTVDCFFYGNKVIRWRFAQLSRQAIIVLWGRL